MSRTGGRLVPIYFSPESGPGPPKLRRSQAALHTGWKPALPAAIPGNYKEIELKLLTGYNNHKVLISFPLAAAGFRLPRTGWKACATINSRPSGPGRQTCDFA
jgi:hypothetical protein